MTRPFATCETNASQKLKSAGEWIAVAHYDMGRMLNSSNKEEYLEALEHYDMTLELAINELTTARELLTPVIPTYTETFTDAGSS